ncbi:MAG: SDR family NAD(P)-dependent oxidoreductase [Candidatus Hodarchaeales archaeon]|jgi:3-oxoacyl-[acyl-carrier protein] reductase
MDSGLRGKHILITGASGGIGQAIARCFDEEGCVLSLHYHKNYKGIQELTSGLKGQFISFEADMTSEESISNLFSESIKSLGRIEILIVNHGIWPETYNPVHEMSATQWDNTVNVNLRAAFLCSKYFLRNLEEHAEKSANIIFIGSTAGVFGEAGHVDYAVSKAGLFGLMLSLKNEIIHLTPQGLGRVNIVAPGWTISPMTEKFMDDHESIQSALQTMPLRKLARVEDIANTVVFLSSDKLAGHISGQLITVAGGMEGRKLFKKEEINIDKV